MSGIAGIIRFDGGPAHAVTHEVDGELVILDLDMGPCFGPGPVGARVCEHLSKGARQIKALS